MSTFYAISINQNDRLRKEFVTFKKFLRIGQSGFAYNFYNCNTIAICCTTLCACARAVMQLK
jgi:hypothetical protein